MNQLFAIFGNPVSHSKSPLMHNMAFKVLEYNGCYTRYLLEDGNLLKDKFHSLGLSGANITVPHKEAAFKACDELDSFALKVGAVNTIILKNDKLMGYNTDAPGFLKCVKDFVGTKNILILGAGGTVKSTSYILKEQGYIVDILARNADRLKDFENNFDCFTFESFKEKKYNLIINMTSAGLQDELLPAPKELLENIISNSSGVIDIIYGKQTPFLKLAKNKNISSKDGIDMLINQGVLAFDYFTNHQFSLSEIEDAMEKAFSR
ncbi:MAG: shikimate dehydrogenase [Sulfurovaceae bacterium]|nr:shikimate dehydrogenase [Sulfurovaceae bacterium]MDD5549094.1 shikimate dehydrogenase [Sulfurovaceae bacterium]